MYSLAGAVQSRGSGPRAIRTPGILTAPSASVKGSAHRFPRPFTPPTLDFLLLIQPFCPCTASPEQHFT